jgi:enolase-phosphatase E1
MKTLLFDIEGTTTDINFVHKVLFPYSQERIAAFVRSHPAHPAVKEIQSELSDSSLENVIATLLQWIREDKKIGTLKTLQGEIWLEGYRQNHFQGHVYPEVKTAFENWKAAGFRLAIYSSGSVAAQKLIFAHSSAGDLTPLLSAYFDTKVGGKRAVESYRRIAQELHSDPSDITFFSDIREELDAALGAGMNTRHVFRGLTQESPHKSITDFTSVDLSS